MRTQIKCRSFIRQLIISTVFGVAYSIAILTASDAPVRAETTAVWNCPEVTDALLSDYQGAYRSRKPAGVIAAGSALNDAYGACSTRYSNAHDFATMTALTVKIGQIQMVIGYAAIRGKSYDIARESFKHAFASAGIAQMMSEHDDMGLCPACSVYAEDADELRASAQRALDSMDQQGY